MLAAIGRVRLGKILYMSDGLNRDKIPGELTRPRKFGSEVTQMSAVSRSAQGLFFSSLFLLAITLHASALKAETPTEDRKSADAASGPLKLGAMVVQLDHRLFAKREQATAALHQAGIEAIPHLTAALHGQSLEAADRSVGVLQQFATSQDRQLQLAALASLVGAEQFATPRRQAERQFNKLQELICAEQFTAWGAKFEIFHHCPTSGGRQTRVVVVIEPDHWSGNRDSFRKLHALRKLDVLRVDAPMVDDQIAYDLAGIESLRTLELINTQASVNLVDQLRGKQSLLKVRIRSKTYLGLSFWQSGSLEVMRVDPGSPAQLAGIEVEDLIDSFNGIPIDTFETLTAHLAQCQPGDEVRIGLRRRGEPHEVTATLAMKDWSTE